MNTEPPDHPKADRLIHELLSAPSSFNEKGLALQLLGQFLHGYSIENLRLLLRQRDREVLKTAIWIASEFPNGTPAVLNEAITLSQHADRYIRYYALDIIILGTRSARLEEFLTIAKRLDDPDSVVAGRALVLLSRGSMDQLRASLERLECVEPNSPHLMGLRALVQAQSLSPSNIEAMIRDNNSLARRYGLAIAERVYDRYPYLLDLAKGAEDEIVKSSATHLLNLHDIRAKPRK